MAETGEPWAALGSRLAAELYGCRVLADGVEDRPTTRRASSGSRRPPIAGAERATPAGKTSIVFWGFNDDSPGALVRVLRELSDREINLTQDRVAPTPGGSATTCSSPTSTGGADEPPVGEALEAIAATVESCACSAPIRLPKGHRGGVAPVPHTGD